LKVWQGFNGNIYFEPIYFNNFNSQRVASCQHCNELRNDKNIDKKNLSLSKAKTKDLIKVSKIENEQENQTTVIFDDLKANISISESSKTKTDLSSLLCLKIMSMDVFIYNRCRF